MTPTQDTPEKVPPSKDGFVTSYMQQLLIILQKMRSSNFGLRVLGVIVCSMGVGGVLTLCIKRHTPCQHLSERPKGLDPFLRDIFQKIERVHEMIAQGYVAPLCLSTRERLIQGAVSGMLKSLDAHSTYLTPDMRTRLAQSYRGDFCGVGLEVSPDETGALQVIAPIDQTAAFRSGLRAGDRIVKIDGVWIFDRPPEESMGRLRGPAGTSVTLHIRRPGGGASFDVVLERHPIQFQSTQARVLDASIGYIRIAYFDHNAKRLTQDALRFFQQSHPHLEGFILDLRDNPGGLLDQAIGVADLFLPKGPIVLIRTADNPQGMLVFSNPKPLTPLMKIPLVILVNGGSASGAEVLASALKDNNRGVIVGERTFGKASVQAVYPLESGDAIKLTVAHYDPPSGRSIQSRGLEPDIVLLGTPDSGTQPEETPPSHPAEGLPLGVPEKADLQLTQALNVLRAMIHQNRQGVAVSLEKGGVKTIGAADAPVVQRTQEPNLPQPKKLAQPKQPF